jgi:hypothetical protein
MIWNNCLIVSEEENGVDVLNLTEPLLQQGLNRF